MVFTFWIKKHPCSSFKNNSSKRGTFYFTHSGTILKFLAFLNLYRDLEPLTSDNYDRLKDARLWRTSRIDAFGSNVAFVLKSCDNTLTTGQTGRTFYKHWQTLSNKHHHPILWTHIFNYITHHNLWTTTICQWWPIRVPRVVVVDRFDFLT